VQREFDSRKADLPPKLKKYKGYKPDGSKGGHMKATVYEGPRSIMRQERLDLSAEAAEVIIKIKYCGICGTGLHAYRHGIMACR
jgi:hypothetical protein